MSTWLARLKNRSTPETGATKTTKPTQDTPKGVFVGFVAHPQGHIQKFDGAANAPTTDPDRWAWPHSDAWNTAEIELFNRRAALFVRRGAGEPQAEAMADSLVRRDREQDDRHVCHECRHLQTAGFGGGLCGNGAAAGFTVRGWGAGLARDFTAMLQRCPGFAAAGLPATTPTFVAAPAPATQASPTTVGHSEGAPPTAAPAPEQPRTPSGPSWRQLDRAYLAHHLQCSVCQCAGRG